MVHVSRRLDRIHGQRLYTVSQPKDHEPVVSSVAETSGPGWRQFAAAALLEANPNNLGATEVSASLTHPTDAPPRREKIAVEGTYSKIHDDLPVRPCYSLFGFELHELPFVYLSRVRER